MQFYGGPVVEVTCVAFDYLSSQPGKKNNCSDCATKTDDPSEAEALSDFAEYHRLVSSFEFGVSSSAFGVSSSGFRVSSSEFRVRS